MIEILQKICLEAANAILQVYEQENLGIEHKTDDSPLTLADRLSNRIIVDGLQKNFPDIPILSEEEAQVAYEIRKNWEKFWLVDPLDGTKEFISRNGEFTVNIALIENKLPVLGIIYVPVSQEMYFGQVGQGAYKIYQNKQTRLQANQKSPQEALIAVGSRSHSAVEEEQFLEKYTISQKISKGSSLKFCLLAEGKADIYFRHNPTMEWDTAAGQAIVEAAGARVLDSQGTIFSYNKENLRNGSFLCTIF